jgi:hypothetical protein
MGQPSAVIRSVARRSAALVGLSVAACGDGHNHGTADAGYDCSIEDRDDTFVAGLEKLGDNGTLTFRLASSTPAPPSRGDNTWMIDVLGGGSPVTGATLTLTPFMPDHRHGTPITPVVTEQLGGQYQATPVNLWMPGLWEVTIEATPAGGAADSAVYRFCIPG